MRLYTILIALVIVNASAWAQKKALTFDHIEPPFWWVGMKSPTVQLLFHKKDVDLRSYQVTTTQSGINIKEVKTVENPHYLFITLELSGSTKAGKVPLTFSNGKKSYRVEYELKEKGNLNNRIQGFNPSDVLYLIMPDRFANGDPRNDSVPGMFEGVKRSNPEARHGGDLKGISDHLDYLKELGVTALWLNPVLENNQRRASYHGYAITDLYKVDRRFGSNEDYVSFINKSHSMGLKVIQDMVMNHIGNEHWLVLDPPDKTWVHQFPAFTRSNYRSSVISDPYRAEEDVKLMNDGWFDTTMPDVDQTNPLFATYLIQNTLWWIEYAGLDGIRMDTYPYPDKNFMARWCKEVMEQYPSFNIVGEVWINDVATTAYWQKDSHNSDKDKYQSHLPSVTDFPLFFAIPQALSEQGGWESGLFRLYNTLAKDFVYPNAAGNLIFLDNHDLSRFYLMCGKDLRKFKMALTFLLTTRGIPQLYYGTELLMDGDGGYHPNVRLDFPGGWQGDKTNAFKREGRTAEQNEAFDHLQKLLNWRKNEKAIHEGKLTHYIPENNTYVYFRHLDKRVVMVILNANDTAKSLNSQRYRQNMKGAKTAKNFISGETVKDLSTIDVPAWSSVILEFDTE
jgi:neopullulanase